MIKTCGCLARYRQGEDPSSKINGWLKENPQAHLIDVKLVPTEQYSFQDVYVLMLIEVPDKVDEKEEA